MQRRDGPGLARWVLGGSWVVISEVISRVPLKGSIGLEGLGFRVVISRVISPLIRVVSITTLVITPLITTHEPPSTECFASRRSRRFGTSYQMLSPVSTVSSAHTSVSLPVLELH